MKFPRFVAIINDYENTCCLRLIKVEDGAATYYRDGGDWSLVARYVESKLVSDSGLQTEKISNKVLVKVSKAEWTTCNGKYAPKL